MKTEKYHIQIIKYADYDQTDYDIIADLYDEKSVNTVLRMIDFLPDSSSYGVINLTEK